MNKRIITVPNGIRYIGDWPEFDYFPGPNIVNKTITGCGYTEFCIRNDQNVILCSPRRILLENKEDQHRGEVLYLRNDLDYPKRPVDSEVKLMKYRQEENIEESSIESYFELQQRVKTYYMNCNIVKRPCKILVTYDSFRHVKEALGDLIQNFQIVVDEFQSIFMDSRFKPEVEDDFLTILRGLSNITFVSATPMLDKYLEMLDEFKDLDYYELDWFSDDPSRIYSPQIEVKSCRSILNPAKDYIDSYKNGQFEEYSYIDDCGNIINIPSTELVIYVNSVKNICDLISKCGLTYENTNVLCSDTPENRLKVRKAFGIKKLEKPIGSVPKKGEPHKMFTLCTRTVYLGADFYSTCARTLILSDANIDCLAVDISLDLPQIMGRQRLDENPWKNRADLYFKCLKKSNIQTQDEFNQIVREKTDRTESLISSYAAATGKDRIFLCEKYSESINYKRDYLSISSHGGSHPFPVFNRLILVSDLRAFEIQQVDYRDRFSVFSRLIQDGHINETIDNIKDLVRRFNEYSTFTDHMRFLCEEINSDYTLELVLEQIPLIYKKYITVLGRDRIKANSYQKNRIDEEFNEVFGLIRGHNQIKTELENIIVIGESYTYTYLKILLQEVYNKCGIPSKVAKARDLEKYYEVKKVKILNSEDSSKRDHGFKVIKKLGD